MARTKSIPIKRKSVTSTMPGRRTYSTAGLNSRILSVLKSTQEVKRRSFRTSYANPTAGANDTLCYSDIFASISLGAGVDQRIGDKIIVDKICITQRYIPVHSTGVDQNVISADLRLAILVSNEAMSGTATMNTYAPAKPFVYNGYFQALGVINDMDRKVIAFSDKHTDGNNFVGTNAAGIGTLSCTNKLYKKWPKGYVVRYKQATNEQADTSMYVVGALDVPGRGATAAIGTLYCDYAIDVFFRDS